MAGKVTARYRVCKKGCPYRISRHESQTGPEGYSSEFCAYGSKERELSEQFMKGPTSNCPAGFWADKITVREDGHAERVRWSDGKTEDCGPFDDSEAWRQWNQQQNREAKRQRFKGPRKQDAQQIEDSPDIAADAETALACGVVFGCIPPWLADEIRNEL